MDQEAFLSSLEQQYNLPSGYLSRIRQIESGGNDRAVSPTGASGPFQFTKGTAKQYDLADRFDFEGSASAAARLAADNRAHLVRALGRDVGGAELYLAHQQGAGGASSLLSGGGADRFNMDVNGGAGMAAPDFANMWLNKYNQTPGFNPAAGSRGGLTVSTSGGPSVEPYTPRQSVIKQLFGGEGMAGVKKNWKSTLSNMFNPMEGANPALEAARFRDKAERFSQIAALAQQGYQNTNAPASWLTVLGDVGATIGANAMSGAQTRAMGQADTDMTELMSGPMTPDRMAKIAALDPEYGQRLQQDQTDFEQQQAIMAQNQAFDREQSDVGYARDLAGQQAEWEHELELAKLAPEERTAMERQLIAAGYDPQGPLGADGLNDFQREMRKQIQNEKSGAPGMRLTFDAAGNPVLEQGPGVTGGVTTAPTVPTAGVAGTTGDPTGIGKIEPGMAQGIGPNGEILQAPVPGSPEDVKRQQAAAAAENADNTKMKTANDVLAAIDQVEKLSDSFFATGAPGKLLRDVGIGGTPAMDIDIALRPVIANMGFDRLQQMRAASETGAALGQVTERENTLLQSTIKSLDPNGSKELFKQNLQYVKDQYDVIVNTDPSNPADVKRYEEVMGFPLENRASVAAAQAPAPAAGGAGDLPNITTQEQYDALPSGTVFLEDGVEMVKP